MGSNPQSDPRIFPEIPGFSRSLTHSLTHGVFYRPTLFACGKIPEKPEATGSAGRRDPGVGGLLTHTLSPAHLSHPLCWPDPGLFPEERNPMFFRRKRRVPRTRGFLRERVVGSVPHTGAHTGLFWAGMGTFPTLGRNSAHRVTRGATGGTGFLSGGEHIRTGLFRLFLGGISVIQELPDGGRHVALVKTA